MRDSWTLPLALATLLSPPLSLAANAGTLEVPEDFPTIELAVKSAGPGDTVRISSGTYHESFYVNKSQVGLRLEGKGKVVFDAHPSAAPAGDPIRIYADDVKVEGITFRHLRGDDAAVLVLANDVTLEDLVVEDADDAGVRLGDGYSGLRLEDCRFHGVSVGVELGDGSSATIDDCQFEAVGTAIKALTVGLLRVEDSRFRRGSYAVRASGGSLVFDDNEVEQFAVGVWGFGLADVRVEDNEFEHNGETIVIDQVIGGEVVDNEIEDCGAGAITVSSSFDVLVKDNEVDGAGFGIYVVKSKVCSVTGNKIKDCTEDGIFVDGTSNLVADNEVRSNLKDGIRVYAGDGNQVVHNKVSKNGGEGLCNKGTNTVWDDNSAKKNRIDLANSGSVSATGNSYKSGGVSTNPQVED